MNGSHKRTAPSSTEHAEALGEDPWIGVRPAPLRSRRRLPTWLPTRAKVASVGFVAAIATITCLLLLVIAAFLFGPAL